MLEWVLGEFLLDNSHPVNNPNSNPNPNLSEGREELSRGKLSGYRNDWNKVPMRIKFIFSFSWNSVEQESA